MASLASLVGALAWSRLPRGVGSAASEELKALRSTRERLAEFDDATRRQLERQVAVSGAGRLPAHDLRAEFGHDWRIEQKRYGVVLERGAAPLRAWRDVLETIRMIEAERGAAIESLEIVADGSGTDRAFRRIKIVVRFAGADSNTAR